MSSSSVPATVDSCIYLTAKHSKQTHHTTPNVPAMTQQNSRAPKVILFVSTFIFPPLPIFMFEGLTKEFLISLLLTVFGLHLLGVLYTLFYLWPYLTDNAPIAGQTTTTAGQGNGIHAVEDVLERGEAATTDQPQQSYSPWHDHEPAEEHQPIHPKHEQGHHEQGQSEPPSYLDATADASSTTPLIVAAAATNDHKIQR